MNNEQLKAALIMQGTQASVLAPDLLLNRTQDAGPGGNSSENSNVVELTLDTLTLEVDSPAMASPTEITYYEGCYLGRIVWSYLTNNDEFAEDLYAALITNNKDVVLKINSLTFSGSYAENIYGLTASYYFSGKYCVLINRNNYAEMTPNGRLYDLPALTVNNKGNTPIIKASLLLAEGDNGDKRAGIDAILLSKPNS